MLRSVRQPPKSPEVIASCLRRKGKKASQKGRLFLKDAGVLNKLHIWRHELTVSLRFLVLKLLDCRKLFSFKHALPLLAQIFAGPLAIAFNWCLRFYLGMLAKVDFYLPFAQAKR